MENIKIIHVEDDEVQRSLVKKWLEARNIECQSYDSKQAFLKADTQGVACFILDWELPDGTGIEILTELRKNGDNRPVLFATLRDDEDDIVSALEAGADDYIVKPIRQNEFTARINVILRRLGQSVSTKSENEMPDISPFEIDIINETIHLHGELIPLTYKEYQLALFFFTHVGELVSRDTIMKHIWQQSNDLNTRTIDTHISRVRQKLKFGEESGWKLFSIYLHGYRLRKIDCV